MLGTRGSHKQRTNMHTVTCSLATYVLHIYTHTHTHSHMLTRKTHVILCTHTHSHSHKTTCLVSHKEQGRSMASPWSWKRTTGPDSWHSSRKPGGSHQGTIHRGSSRPSFPHCKAASRGAGGHNRECIANGSPLETLSHQNSSQG